MELKPTKKVGWDPEGKRPVKPLESIGAGGETPWDVVAMGARAGKRKRWGAAELGATPPRDGPFQVPAGQVAGLMPPKTRTKRQTAMGTNPWTALQAPGPRGRRGTT